jgi:hypothetical protein
MYKLGYGKNMVISKNPDTGEEAFAFKTPLTYSINGDIISVKSDSGKSIDIEKSKANPALRARIERNQSLSKLKGFKQNADIITGPVSGVAFE